MIEKQTPVISEEEVEEKAQEAETPVACDWKESVEEA